MTTVNQARPNKRSPYATRAPFLPIPTHRAISAALDRAVWERDRGVCHKCGTDLEEIRAQLDAYFAAAKRLLLDDESATEQARTYGALLYGEHARAWPHRLWERHHIVSVSEGGHTTLDNLRTLCEPCHQAETKKLAGRLALHRKRHGYRPHIPEGLQ